MATVSDKGLPSTPQSAIPPLEPGDRLAGPSLNGVRRDAELKTAELSKELSTSHHRFACEDMVGPISNSSPGQAVSRGPHRGHWILQYLRAPRPGQ